MPQPFQKRFVQIHWTRVRNLARTETRFATILSLSGTGTTAIRVEGKDFVQLDRFRIDRTSDNATEAAIFIYKNGTDVPNYIELDWVKVTNNRSRAGSIVANDANALGITNCSTYETQRKVVENNNWYIHGSGIQALRSSNVYIANAMVSDSHDFISSLGNSRRLFPGCPNSQRGAPVGGCGAAVSSMRIGACSLL